MKWLLITTAQRTAETPNSNIGDEFACRGVQELIKAVDSSPVFDILDKENPKAWSPRLFDKAVLCGMPLFWSLPGREFPGIQNCQQVWWYPRIFRGWPTAVRERFMAVGVGHVYVDRILSLMDYTAAIQEVLDKSWRLTVREPVLDHPRIVDSVCPSLVCYPKNSVPEGEPVRLCNLMPSQGHFGYLIPEDRKWSKEKTQKIALVLLHNHFSFVAHTKSEAEYALKLGWAKSKVFYFNSVGDYLSLYRRCTAYFGHRMHGAMAALAAGASAFAVCGDSRSGMVARSGGFVQRPSGVNLEELSSWAANPTGGRINATMMASCFDTLLSLLKEFMEAKDQPPWTE
jgi:hypothetical protein